MTRHQNHTPLLYPARMHQIGTANLLLSSLTHLRCMHPTREAQQIVPVTNKSTMTASSSSSKETFLPGINKRYLKSFVGLLHALCSVIALVVGNYLFLQCFLLGNDILASSGVDGSSLLPTIFHVTTAVSGECLSCVQ